MPELPKLISIKEVSKLLGVTPLTLRNWDRDGKLKALRHPMNNYRVYRREDIENLLLSITAGSAIMIAKSRKSKRRLEVRHLSEKE